MTDRFHKLTIGELDAVDDALNDARDLVTLIDVAANHATEHVPERSLRRGIGAAARIAAQRIEQAKATIDNAGGV